MRLISKSILLVCMMLGLSLGIRAEAGQFGKERSDRPNFEALHSLALTQALQSPDALWTFLTDPETPYGERMAAAVQGKKVFALSGLSRLMSTVLTLQEERELHHWGLKPAPHSGIGSFSHRSLPASERTRLILGHKWEVPDPPVFAPENWKEEQALPWPAQVDMALDKLFQEIAPPLNWSADPLYTQAWYAEASRWPCTTDREARVYVWATRYTVPYQTIPMLIRWHQIALDSRFPLAARSVANAIVEAMHDWDDPQARNIGQAMTCDILRSCSDTEARLAAGWYSTGLKYLFLKGRAVPPPPMAVVIALGDAAMDAKCGSEWDRIYHFVIPACKLLPDPPIKYDLTLVRAGSPEAHKALTTFCEWFSAHRAELEKAGEEQLKDCPEITVIRGGK